MAIALTGKIMGSVTSHTPETLKAVFEKAYAALPLSDGSLFEGTLEQFSGQCSPKATVLFIHGSSGINPATRTFANHLAKQGFAVLAPDSMQVKDRITYSSPVAREVYEQVHSMRYEELSYAVSHLHELPFFNGKFVIAGTSEGAVSVARFVNESENKEAGRMIFSWSCENNYHVVEHRTQIPADCPVLNIMSAEDPYFSQKNSYLDNPEALGYAARALKDHQDATIVLLPQAPHTLFNLPRAAGIIDTFVNRVTQ